MQMVFSQKPEPYEDFDLVVLGKMPESMAYVIVPSQVLLRNASSKCLSSPWGFPGIWKVGVLSLVLI